MSINRVIINSSPLIVLFKSQQAELLPQLFAEILVPSGVFEEVTMSGEDDAASRQLPGISWIKRVEITALAPEVAAWDLGKGESQVLSLALKTSANSAAIVDDRAARRCGQALGITTIGTGGILIRAKRRGLIKNVSSGIEALRDAGLWLSDSVVNLLKQQAGE
jgi:predicted nucleic acid-binding protein